MDNLTIIIPYRDDPAGLSRLLETLPAGVPALVCNDKSCEIPPIERPDTRVIHLEQRGYFSGAINTGIRACKTDVLVLNQDIWLTDGRWIEAIEMGRRHCAMIGDGVFGHPAWPMGYVQGTFMFLRRDAICKVGLFNEQDFPLWGATADWQARICRAGYRAQPATGHGWFLHERREASRYGKAITAALAEEPAKRMQFIRTPPLVSVVIPTFNYGRYLPDALGSLMGGKTCLGNLPGQTFTAWEAIIVDDASTDDTQAIGEALADPWKGIRYMRLPHNQGCPAAINAGVQAAFGAACVTLSADDMLEPEFLEACYRALEAQPNSLIYTDQAIFDGSRRGKAWTMPDYDFEKLLERNHVPAGTMYPKEGWRKAGGYPTAFKWGREDWAFAVAMGRAGFCGVHIAKPLFLYRRAGQSRTLRNSGISWRQLFGQQMREIFPDLYGGERPMGCCGGGRKRILPGNPKGAGMAGGDKMKVGEMGLILIEYVGDNVGRTVVRGAATGQRYEFSGSRRVGYVDRRDVSAILALRYGKRPQFRQHVAPAPVEELATPAPAPPPAPAPVPEPPAPVAIAAAMAVAETSPLTQGRDLALEPAPAKPKRRRGKKADAA